MEFSIVRMLIVRDIVNMLNGHGKMVVKTITKDFVLGVKDY